MRYFSPFVLLAGMLLTAPPAIGESVVTPATAVADVLSVHNDYGGSVVHYKFKIDALPTATLVRISGVCGSACTMYLGHSNVCTTPHTRFRFHGPSEQGTPLQPHEFELLSGIMATYYPEPLRSQFLATLRFSIIDTTDFTGHDLAMLGVVNLC